MMLLQPPRRYPTRHWSWTVTGPDLRGASLTNPDTLSIFRFYPYVSTHAIGDRTGVYVWLEAGDYELHTIGYTASNQGIMAFTVDGQRQGTIDYYTAGTVANVDKTIPVTIPSSGSHLIEIEAVGKNASSTDYYRHLIVLYLKQVNRDSTR